MCSIPRIKMYLLLAKSAMHLGHIQVLNGIFRTADPRPHCTFHVSKSYRVLFLNYMILKKNPKVFKPQEFLFQIQLLFLILHTGSSTNRNIKTKTMFLAYQCSSEGVENLWWVFSAHCCVSWSIPYWNHPLCVDSVSLSVSSVGYQSTLLGQLAYTILEPPTVHIQFLLVCSLGSHSSDRVPLGDVFHKVVVVIGCLTS